METEEVLLVYDGEESGKMVACDNESCKREWFHFDCVGLTRKPRGKWYCSNQCEQKSKSYEFNITINSFIMIN